MNIRVMRALTATTITIPICTSAVFGSMAGEHQTTDEHHCKYQIKNGVLLIICPPNSSSANQRISLDRNPLNTDCIHKRKRQFVNRSIHRLVTVDDSALVASRRRRVGRRIGWHTESFRRYETRIRRSEWFRHSRSRRRLMRSATPNYTTVRHSESVRVSKPELA